MKKSLFLIIVISITHSIYSQEIKVDNLSIFTDGNSYVQKSGKINVVNQQFTLEKDNLPVPRYGTLKINSLDNSLQYISSSLGTTTESYDISDLATLLVNNIGSTVEVNIEDQNHKGKIISVVDDHLILKSDSYTIVRLGYIKSYRFFDEIQLPNQKMIPSVKIKYDPYGKEIKEHNQNSRVVLNFKNSGPKEIEISYLQKGISWNPIYHLTLENNKVAKLNLQAEIINDSEKLENTNIELVVGKPNFRYQNHLTDLIDYNNELDPFFEIKSKNNYNSGISLDEIIVRNNKQENQRFHDFQIYNLEDISLDKNSRAIFDIYNYDVPYKHIYECTLAPVHHEKRYNYNSNKSKGKDKVYHSLEIENTTKTLIGKGSVLILDKRQKNLRPLAQSSTSFIPLNAKGTIKLTENNEVEISRNEKIIKREEKEYEFLGNDFYKAVIEGTIKVVNYNNHNIELHLNTEITGELNGMNNDMEVVNQKQPYQSPNYQSTVKWKKVLKPNQTIEIKYQYELYVD